MRNVLVRDLPDDVHAALQRRAKSRGESLQRYLAAELRRIAQRPDLDELLAGVERRTGGRVGLDQAVEDLKAGRSRR